MATTTGEAGWLAVRLAWLVFPIAWQFFLPLVCGSFKLPANSSTHAGLVPPLTVCLACPACLPACPCSKFAINFDGGAKARLYLQSEQWEPLDLELLQVLPPCTASGLLYRQRCAGLPACLQRHWALSCGGCTGLPFCGVLTANPHALPHPFFHCRSSGSRRSAPRRQPRRCCPSSCRPRRPASPRRHARVCHAQRRWLLARDPMPNTLMMGRRRRVGGQIPTLQAEALGGAAGPPHSSSMCNSSSSSSTRSRRPPPAPARWSSCPSRCRCRLRLSARASRRWVGGASACGAPLC